MIILLGAEKGGTGKTTLATNISALFAQKGKDILLIDTDKQGSASLWAATRESNSNVKPVTTIQKFGSNLHNLINDMKKKYDHIIIDAGGRDSVELRSAMAVSTKMYIPLQASQFDVWTLGAMDKLVGQAKAINSSLEAFVIINRASTNPSVSETKEALGLFDDLETIKLSKIVIKERISYRKAAREGLAVNELPNNANRDLKAIDEINSFFNEINDDAKTQAA